jgi:hypothetical protein
MNSEQSIEVYPEFPIESSIVATPPVYKVPQLCFGEVVISEKQFI